MLTLAQELPEAFQRKIEEDSAEREERCKQRPYDTQASPAEQRRLTAGISVISAVPKMAAIWLCMRAEMRSPMLLVPVTSISAASVNVRKLPVKALGK